MSHRPSPQLSLDLTWRSRPLLSSVSGGPGPTASYTILALPGFDRLALGRLIVMAEAGDLFAGGSANLEEAIAYAVDRAQASRLCSESSLNIYAGKWRGFARYARRAAGVTTIAEMSRGHVARRYLVAPLPGGARPAGRTIEGRGTALKFLFRIWRDVGLLDHDPLLDVTPPPRGTSRVRPLTTAEVERCRAAAPGTLVATREPAAWALLETGASTSEVGSVRHGHLDLLGAYVRVGVGTPAERDVPLSAWSLAHLRRLDGAPDDWVLVGSVAPSGDSRRTRATELVRAVMGRAGVWGPGVSARSVTAWAGRQVWEETRSIEAAARRLGSASLDATAALIGHDWYGS